MVDQEQVKKLLTELLSDVAAKAREDALNDRSDIASIYKRDRKTTLNSLDPAKVEEAIAYINRATATKEGARRIINAIMVAAKAVAQVYFPR